MRFVIYREEFVHGRRSQEMREALFATENASLARARQELYFEEEVKLYRERYSRVTTSRQGQNLIVAAPDDDCFTGIGIIDELNPLG